MTGDATAAAHVLPGTVLVGKYRVDRILGQGGMGVVVAAHHLQLDEKVALKFLLPEALHDAHADARFLREAQAAVKIKSEHVARVTDVGRLENGLPYMVMEYLEGRDLSTWLAQYGRLPVPQAVDFLLQACEAIAEAHSLGIVHRDLKPANLFCVQRRDGALAIKVLDFGISKVTTPGALGHDVTRTTTVIGSPTYMSPEQLRASRDVDARSDIWSLGVILYELLSGRTPFESQTVTDLAIMIATEPGTPLRTYRGDVPAAIEQVIARCLEKDRARRFASVAELASALEGLGTRSASTSVERIRGTQRVTSPSFPQLPSAAPRLQLDATMTAPLAPAPQGPPTMATWGHTGGLLAPRRSPVAFLAGLGVAAVALLATAALIVARLLHPSASAATGPSATSAVAEPSVMASAVTPSFSPSPVPSAEPPPSSTTAAAALSASSPPSLDSAPASVSAPISAPLASPAPVLKAVGVHHAAAGGHAHVAGCDPPYTVDELGRKHFKPQCFGDH